MELAFALLPLGGLDVAICLHTAEPVPTNEWDDLITRLASHIASGAEPQRARMLVVTDGGAPDARQRSQLGRLRGGQVIQTAVLVPGMNNPLKRGLMTALTWFNPHMAFFVPTQLSDALHHVGLTETQAQLWTALLGLQRQLPPVRTLQLIAQAAQLPLGSAKGMQRVQ
ncbi:MAG: hypothetical protein ABW352_22765 [Polyangiales bacterium]